MRRSYRHVWQRLDTESKDQELYTLQSVREGSETVQAD